ncbi:MAG: Spy/CpxP family protein refolding chaperone [Ignavibacteriales bacterium]
MVPLRKRLVWAALALVIIVGIAGVAAAAPAAGQLAGFGRAWCGMGGFGGMGKGGAGQLGQGAASLIEKVNLTDEQIERIREINAGAFERIQALQASMSQKVFELQNLCWQRDPDEDAIAAKRDEITALREQMSEIREQMQGDLENILTEEQQEALSQLKGAVRGRRGRGKAGGPAKTPAAGDTGTTSN